MRPDTGALHSRLQNYAKFVALRAIHTQFQSNGYICSMITYLDYPEGTPVRELPFYLATEELVALELPGGSDYFFMWRVDPSVIIGRNQVYETEVNSSFCHDNGISIWRRKSGGGCVYADMNNIMISFITDTGRDVTTTFARYTERVAAMLRSLGMDARAGSRNDVTLGPRKISGNAFYRLPNGRSIAHGTMLFDIDLDTMTRAITPPRIKLESKGVDSVRSRVTCAREHKPGMTLEEFMQAMRNYMSDNRLTLTPEQLRRVEEIERPYLTEEWIRGHSPRGTMAIDRRIEGAGDFHIELTTRQGVIEEINLSGDFFLMADLDSSLLDRLRGVRLSHEALTAALAGIDTESIIMGLSREAVVSLLI